MKQIDMKQRTHEHIVSYFEIVLWSLDEQQKQWNDDRKENNSFDFICEFKMTKSNVNLSLANTFSSVEWNNEKYNGFGQGKQTSVNQFLSWFYWLLNVEPNKSLFHESIQSLNKLETLQRELSPWMQRFTIQWFVTLGEIVPKTKENKKKEKKLPQVFWAVRFWHRAVFLFSFCSFIKELFEKINNLFRRNYSSTLCTNK
jgi:hypothetical protein